MSEPTILIIEPNLEYSKSLSRELKDLGFNTIIKTDIVDPDLLIKLPQNIVSIVLNLELRSIEGLTIYSFLKNHRKFRETTFTFLADDDNTFYLLDNMPLERAIVVKKESRLSRLIGDIVDNIEFTAETAENDDYVLDVSGKLEQINVPTIFQFCQKTYFSGKLVINHSTDFGIVLFKNGEIETITFKQHDKATAIQHFSRWKSGNFRLERLKYSIASMINIAHGTVPAGDKPAELTLGISDLLLDVFAFLHGFLSNQISGGQVNYIFQESIQSFKQNYPEKNTFSFTPYDGDKIKFNHELQTEDVRPHVELFKQIFSTAKSYHPEIEMNDILEKLKELEPYLKKIDFLNLLLNEERLVDVTELYALDV